MNVPRVIKGQIAMKVEVTPGTDVFAGTYTSADIIPVIADSIRYSQDPNEIPNMMTAGLMGRAPSILGATLARVDFSTYFRGAGAAYDDSPEVVPTTIDRPLRCCRMGRTFTNPPPASPSSLTYAPTDTEESFTLYIVDDVPSGNAHSIQMVGCIGTHSWSITAGGVMRFDFTIFGALEEMADISYVAGTLTNTPAYPTFKSAAFQIGSANYAPRFRDISFTQNATVRPVPAPNASSGVAGFATMDREPRLTFDPEMDRQANSGWWAMLRDGAPMNDCTFKVGVAGGSPGWNQIKMRFPSNGSSAQLQLTSQTRSSRDGLVTLPSTLLATLATGNDDFSYLLDNV